ncbi:penicillin-binding protein 2, partial [Candidatus Falkowbacteria bacterium]|nr:penicillin-binding protein 2 [Candidatus Falkowbacteria bacterium]
LYSDATRNYLKTDEAPSLSHILGYVGKIEENQLEDYLNSGYLIDDHVGKAGLEFFYENELKGVNGREQVEVDAIGAAKEVIASERPIPGNNLILTIDSELQAVAEKSLQKALSSYGKRRGAVIIMDPNSGEVLAMVSLPTFDNNIFSRGISREDFSKLINDPDKPLYTRAISGEYPSGSTFKMIVGAAALEEGIINSWTGFSSVGGIRVNQWFFPDWKFGGHGWTTITKALAESVNTFFYTIGGGYEDFVGLGVEKIKAYAVRFGLTQKLGIDLPNEAAGFFPSIAWKEKTKGERWYVGDTYNLSIGQGDILITPLQLALWTSTFANGGTVYKPYVVKEILDAGNSVSREIKPRVLNEDF